MLEQTDFMRLNKQALRVGTIVFHATTVTMGTPPTSYRTSDSKSMHLLRTELTVSLVYSEVDRCVVAI